MLKLLNFRHFATALLISCMRRWQTNVKSVDFMEAFALNV